jgi:sigma-B regulation protein RsbU (phosphoserine phosphatase)
MDPAREVGGDFYDYFLIDNDHLGIVIADVSGKGIPASLIMMISKVILQNCAMMGRSPSDVLATANNAICANNQEDMFVTVWLGILEISTGKLTAASAGHEYPAVMHAGGDYELWKNKHGFVVGVMEGMQWAEYELQMQPGDRLFLYTDGVPEATSKENELFGTDRMLEALNTVKDASPEDVLKGVRKAIDNFVKDAEQFDDLTMLSIVYKGPQA